MGENSERKGEDGELIEVLDDKNGDGNEVGDGPGQGPQCSLILPVAWGKLPQTGT